MSYSERKGRWFRGWSPNLCLRTVLFVGSHENYIGQIIGYMLLAFPLHLTRIIINYFDFFGSTANFHIFGACGWIFFVWNVHYRIIQFDISL